MSRLKRWLFSLHGVPLVGLARAVVVLLPRQRELRAGGRMTALLEPEPEPEVAVAEPQEHDWPTVNVETLGPEDDEGGPTSYYSGEVTGITQVLRLIHNISAGKKADEGLRDVPKDERIFDLDR